MPKKRSKGKARTLAAQSAQESGRKLGVLTPTDFITSQPLKVCRLCESKDGPFLNIFEADKVTAKKIEELMPFGVAENDDLPHKICFRCSAKVEELHEFIQKCIKTQINLRTALGKNEPFTTKLKTRRSLWEEKLNKSNISNDDICDAVIKKAMESIKDIPINPFPLENNKDIVESNPSASKDLSTGKPVSKNNEVIKTKASQKSLLENAKLTDISKEIIDIDSDGNLGDDQHLTEKPPQGPGNKPKQRNAKSRLLRSNIEKSLPENPKLTEIANEVIDIDSDGNLGADQHLTEKPPQGPDNKPKQRNAKSRLLQSNIETSNNDGQALNKTKTAVKRTSTPDISIATPDKKIMKLETENNEGNSNDTLKKVTKKPRDQNSKQKELNIEPQINTRQPDQTVCGQSTNASANEEKPFDIMDHVSMIKVNGVGVLFQCKLCNRNFLKMDVVQSHSCAKNRCVPKEEIIRILSPPEPPKPPTTVKYINTKLGGDAKKFTISDTTNSNDKTETDSENWRTVTEVSTSKPKPKIGPASKVKRDSEESVTSMAAKKISAGDGPSARKNIPCGSVTLPPTPNLNCPYKLVPGPNNTFTLVEEPVTQEHDSKAKLKLSHESQNVVEIKPKQRQSGNDSGYIGVRTSNSLIQEPGQIEAGKQVHTQPYPVGLFQTLPKKSKPSPPPQPQPANSLIFSATAAQKQSYSILQTGHPSKLLISSKPQVRAEEPVKKRPIKTVPTRAQQMTESSMPFSVTLDDASKSVDPAMYNFYNIDPLLTPSYVLPIPNEPQSVATNNDRLDSSEHLSGGNGHYTCNMCNEVFTREQKLLAHIHSHYSKMDEEDNMRVSKTNRKRARKS